MGNNVSQFEERFNTNYAFVEAIQDPIYGLAKVYRKKFENYHYVMLIERRLQEFKRETLISACMAPQKDDKNNGNIPKILHRSELEYKQQSSMKLQRLKRTLELIKRHQNQLFIPFFSYRVLQGIQYCMMQGSKFECSEPVIQLYVEYHNHRLLEYLDVLRGKGLSLKTTQIIYILKTVCLAIELLSRTYRLDGKEMQIQVTVKQINVKTIYTTNEGEIKLHPIEIITKKQQQTQIISDIETLQTNPIIELNKFNKNQRSSSTKTDKFSNQRYSKSSLPKQKNSLLSSKVSQSPFSSKLNSHKEILIKLLIQLSPYTLSKSSQNKELQKLNLIITKASSLNSIHQKIQKFGNPCIEGLLVERIYDLDKNNNKKQDNFHSNRKKRENSQNYERLQASNSSNIDHSSKQNPISLDIKPNKFKNIKPQNTQFQIIQFHKFSTQRASQNANPINHSEGGKFQQMISHHKKTTQNQNYPMKVNNNQQNVRYEVLNRISQMSQFNQHFPSEIPRSNVQNQAMITVKNIINIKGVNIQKDGNIQKGQLSNIFHQENKLAQSTAIIKQNIMQNPHQISIKRGLNQPVRDIRSISNQ